MMEEHVNKVSNMTCMLKELNVIDHNNNIDVTAMKEDMKQYKVDAEYVHFWILTIDHLDAEPVV